MAHADAAAADDDDDDVGDDNDDGDVKITVMWIVAVLRMAKSRKGNSGESMLMAPHAFTHLS